jgi:hypothetical protein
VDGSEERERGGAAERRREEARAECERRRVECRERVIVLRAECEEGCREVMRGVERREDVERRRERGQLARARAPRVERDPGREQRREEGDDLRGRIGRGRSYALRRALGLARD